jgi:hypothetical protein
MQCATQCKIATQMAKHCGNKSINCEKVQIPSIFIDREFISSQEEDLRIFNGVSFLEQVAHILTIIFE